MFFLNFLGLSGCFKVGYFDPTFCDFTKHTGDLGSVAKKKICFQKVFKMSNQLVCIYGYKFGWFENVDMFRT